MADVYSVLDELGIKYKKYEHPAVFTTKEASKHYRGIDSGQSKNLFLRNKKGDSHFLVVLSADKRLDMKKLASKLGENKLSFASERRLKKYLGLTTGAVSPFGLINDNDHEVKVIVDNKLLKHDKLAFHPNVNTGTLVISVDDFREFLDKMRNEVKYLNL